MGVWQFGKGLGLSITYEVDCGCSILTGRKLELLYIGLCIRHRKFLSDLQSQYVRLWYLES
jgi:hypothetical protein